MTHDLERLVPDELAPGEVTGEETFKLHSDRYHFAASLIVGSRVLDLACGVGYGSRILYNSRRGELAVTGGDICAEAIEYAKKGYHAPGIEFVQCDAMRFEDATGFDTIVSLETIEHLPNPNQFLDNLMTLGRPGFRIIASVPVTPSMDANPYHLQDFTLPRFRRMFTDRGFKEVDLLLQKQRFNPFSILRGKEARAKSLRPRLTSYYVTHPSAAISRITSTLRHGFANIYATIAWDNVAK